MNEKNGVKALVNETTQRSVVPISYVIEKRVGFIKKLFVTVNSLTFPSFILPQPEYFAGYLALH